MLMDILEYYDTKENPHSGWFNIDTKYLFDPVICHMSDWMIRAIVKDLDKKIMNGIKEKLL